MRTQLTTIALVVLAGLFALPTRAADEPVFPKTTAANRKESQNNLKEIGIGMHYFHDAKKAFPDTAAFTKDKKPLLSWRVAILPYLGKKEAALYKEFKLDEPWDSPHNKKLLTKMPKVYAPTVVGKPAREGHTYYQVFAGERTPFNPRFGWTAPGGTLTTYARISSIKDGSANTAMVVEAATPVPWTKPEDIAYDPKKPLPKLGGLFKEGFNVVLFDGSVRMIGRKAKEPAMRALITHSGRDFFDWKDLPGPETK
jgi:hypothetical protein